jgi:hypothetical protein
LRTLREINFELQNVQREMGQLVIQQSDLDNRLAALDRRVSNLEKEKQAIANPKQDEAEI